MGLDIRTPIGLMFTIIGALLVIASLFLDSAVYTRSLGINVNLWWGLVMLVFGGLMLFFGTRGGASFHPTAESPEGLKVEAREHQTGVEADESR
jgi:hypothetical protein